MRLLNRLEQVTETLRAALNAVAAVAPAWLQKHTFPDWYERYGRRIAEYRLPKGKEARQAYAVQVGADYQIDLVGPIYADRQWQATAQEGFDLARFRVDWDAQIVTCPQGRASLRWCETQTARGRTMIHIDFAPAGCTPCPVRSRCTRAKTLPRSLPLQPRAEHEAIQAARRRQDTPEFATISAGRAGIAGTVSQGVRAFGLRQSRYRGLAKTHLQHVATATAINLGRVATWVTGVPRARTRCSRFAALAPTA